MAPNHRASSTGSFIESIVAARKELDNLALSTPESSLDGSSGGSAGTSALGSPVGALSPVTPTIDAPVADSFAFAFDIDGVLIRGGRAIPEAVEAMKMLNGDNEYGIQM